MTNLGLRHLAPFNYAAWLCCSKFSWQELNDHFSETIGIAVSILVATNVMVFAERVPS